jgi:hypothetical protein
MMDAQNGGKMVGSGHVNEIPGSKTELLHW